MSETIRTIIVVEETFSDEQVQNLLDVTSKKHMAELLDKEVEHIKKSLPSSAETTYNITRERVE